MSSRDKILLGVVAALVVLAGSWLAVISPKRDAAAKLDEQIAAQQTQLAQANAQAASYRAARVSLRKNAKVASALHRALPARVAMPTLLRQLEDAAGDEGVTMKLLSTSGTATGTSSVAGVSSLALSLTFDGHFLQLQRLFARLQKFVVASRKHVGATGRLFALDGIKLGSGEGGLPALEANVTASVYVLQPVSLTATTPGAAVPAAAPGAATTTTPTTPTPAATTPAPVSSPTPAATAEVPK